MLWELSKKILILSFLSLKILHDLQQNLTAARYSDLAA